MLENDSKQTITLVCACDNQWLPITAAMLASVFKNNPNRNMVIYLLHNIHHKHSINKLKRWVEKKGQTIQTIYVSRNSTQNLKKSGRFPDAIYYRLLIEELLPPDITKLLYLDSDIIVREDLLPLWETPLDNYALAAVPDKGISKISSLNLAKDGSYFNSGVLLINLSWWREHNLRLNIYTFLENNSSNLEFPDQDALNIVLQGKWLPLPQKWNVLSWYFEQHSEEVKTEITNPAIIHFTGLKKPWNRTSQHPFKKEYWTYQIATPWPYPWANRLRGLTFLKLKEVAYSVYSRGLRSFKKLKKSILKFSSTF